MKVNVEMFTGSLNINVMVPTFISRLNAMRVGLLVSVMTSSDCKGMEGGESIFPAMSLTSSSVTTIYVVLTEMASSSRTLISFRSSIVKLMKRVRPLIVPLTFSTIPLTSVYDDVTFTSSSAFWRVIASKSILLPFTGSSKYSTRKPVFRSISKASSIGLVSSSVTVEA